MTINAAFQWTPQPEAEKLLLSFLEEACKQNSFINSFSKDLEKQTSTRLFDWLDHLVVGNSGQLSKSLEECGFVVISSTSTYRLYNHPGAQLPRLVVMDHSVPVVGVAMNVDSIAYFLSIHGISSEIEGSPFSSYRRSLVSLENDVSLWVVERRGVSTVEPIYQHDDAVSTYFQAKELWQTRPRTLHDEEVAIETTIAIAEELVALVGVNMAACIVLECEREYWQSKNLAAQVQKSRQDRLGMGWANHDHHTFRSTRKNFALLVRLFEILGFHCRERFYAGQEAGWGAQVMENPECRLVLFLDVDLAAEEIEIDFAHLPLPERKTLGTIGLWCALHGDSILNAGMHHLEAQFMFEMLTEDLKAQGIGMMEPFSSFTYLRQAFTKGEMWPVDARRIDVLLQEKKISKETADQFLKKGALGSHLENLQRRDGYKGFNQKNVSFIIKKTDPRNAKNQASDE